VFCFAKKGTCRKHRLCAPVNFPFEYVVRPMVSIVRCLRRSEKAPRKISEIFLGAAEMVGCVEKGCGDVTYSWQTSSIHFSIVVSVKQQNSVIVFLIRQISAAVSPFDFYYD
jgi:hypothetical protein